MTKRKMFFRMVTASLMRRRSRMLIALLAVGIGATILSGLMTIYFDVPRQMGAQFRNYGANMIFTPVEGVFTREDLEEGIRYIDEKELVGATPYRYETVRIHEQPVMAAGTDMESAAKTSPYWSLEGEWPDGYHEILVGKNVAENLNLSIGDSVTLNYTPDSEETASNSIEGEDIVLDNWIDCKVTAILNTGGSEEDYVYIFMDDMEELTQIPDRIDVAEVSVSAASGQLSSYISTINENVEAIRAGLVKRVTASETSVLSKLQGLVLLVTIIVLALTMICVATTMTAVVTERRKEIGLRKALGASDSGIIGEFMGEGLLLGGIGGLIGSGLGFAFAQFVSVNVFSSSISFQGWLLPVTVIASVLVTGLACLMPVRGATQIDPALVLKGE